MGISSAHVSSERPFYDLHADAYDALVTDPVEPWTEAIIEQIRKARKRGNSILDVGCGTGRHARALIDRGYQVSLMDASPALLAIASTRCPGAPTFLADLTRADLSNEFDALACRGVLNDLIEDAERVAAFRSFASLVADDGLLFLDVRDRSRSEQRANGEWREKVVELARGGSLVYSNRPTWRSGRILVDERYELRDAAANLIGGGEYAFQMRPWTPAELTSHLASTGFRDITVSDGVGRSTGDRLFVTARRASRAG